MSVADFLAIVRGYVTAGRWDELDEFFELLRLVINTPVGVLKARQPEDKSA